MISKKILKEYAEVAVSVGANVKKDQLVQVSAPVEAYEFVRYIVEAAYKKGASEVKIKWEDPYVSRLKYEYEETEILSTVPKYLIDEVKENINRGYCLINVISDIPGNLKHIDPKKLSTVNTAMMKALKPYMYYTMNNVGQWTIVAYPNKAWSELVFPKLKGDAAIKALWKAILKAARISADRSIENWKNHNAEIHDHSSKMNKLNFKELRFKNNLGTDITVGLVENHIWEGASSLASNGQMFNPNIPTEEVFTMPDRNYVNGTVVSTKPLNYQGKIIDKFKLTFENGKVVKASAKKGIDALNNLLNTDEGSRHIGEIALISHDSPISNLNILFYNTLFDENASCHMALGRCYPTNIKNGVNMNEKELIKCGGNANSMNHVDFMFGSKDMEVIGITHDNKEVKVFENGNFII